MDKFLKERIDLVAIWARNNGYEDVTRWMLARENKQRKAESGTRKRKVRLAAPDGSPLTGKRGEVWIDPALLRDAVAEEQEQ